MSNSIYTVFNDASKPQAPGVETLELLLKAGPDNIIHVENLINKWKLPWEISTDGLSIVVTKNTGEKYLQQFITKNIATLTMLKEASLCAQSDYEVLITGETGTGKELIAKSMIWDRKGSIRAVNCAGFPETLIESELFGYEKGAFTGATERKIGLIESAKDGVMFLDEIGDLPMSMQAKLLRVFQERKIRKVGAVVDIDINCKFVCATHRDLRKMVADGQFRQDLFARISTLELHILPLRKREEDIIPICLSLPGGEKFVEHNQENLLNGTLEFDLNVRSLQQYVIRYNVLGRVINKKQD